MELLLRTKIENLFKSKDFVDKKTGAAQAGKWKIQTFELVETEQGSQLKLFDVSITDEQYKALHGKVGEVVTIPVRAFINNNKVGFYGI